MSVVHKGPRSGTLCLRPGGRLVRKRITQPPPTTRPASPAGHRRAVIHSSGTPPHPDRTMLFTTFLMTTAVGAAAVQGAMLLKRQPDAVRTRVPYGPIGVAAAVAGLVAL